MLVAWPARYANPWYSRSGTGWCRAVEPVNDRALNDREKSHRSIHPRLPHHSPHPAATHAFRPRINARPIRRQAPTGSPLARPFDLVARRDSHGYDILGGLNQGNVQQRSQPAARLDLGPGSVRVIRPGLFFRLGFLTQAPGETVRAGREQAHSCSPSTWASPSGSMFTRRVIGWQQTGQSST